MELMPELDLERLAIREIIADIEKRKRRELLLEAHRERRPPRERQVLPNKRFLGRTIVSVLQHNQRQSREEKQNSYRKLNELNRLSRGCKLRKSETVRERKVSPKPHDEDEFERQLRLEMCFLGKVGALKTEVEDVPEKEKKKPKKEDTFLTIDLTKKRKKSAKKKKKRKVRKKKIKPKKRRQRKDSTSSSSSGSSYASSSSSTDSISTLQQSLTCTIDLT